MPAEVDFVEGSLQVPCFSKVMESRNDITESLVADKFDRIRLGNAVHPKLRDNPFHLRSTTSQPTLRHSAVGLKPRTVLFKELSGKFTPIDHALL